VNLWLQTAGLILVVLVGLLCGRLFSRWRSPFWTLGYFIPMVLAVLLLLAKHDRTFGSAPLFYWIAGGRVRFVVAALIVTIGLVTPLSRLPRKWERTAVRMAIVLMITCFCVVPFIAPAFFKDTLLSLTTTFDPQGICLQSTWYTCGPAAAVTALNRLGLSANEGELAALSYCNPITGTLPRCLAGALEQRYADKGLRCSFRSFDSIDQLNVAGVTLAVVRETFLWDHCLTVLAVSGDDIVVADPVSGMRTLSHEQFEKIWRRTGIVLERTTSASISNATQTEPGLL